MTFDLAAQQVIWSVVERAAGPEQRPAAVSALVSAAMGTLATP